MCCVIGKQSVPSGVCVGLCVCVYVCAHVCVCVYIHICSMIGMTNAEELAHDAVSGRRGSSAYV